MSDKLETIINQIIDDHPEYTKKGWNPILKVDPESKILIIGQAPGIKTQELGDVFKDQSGDRLREWLGIDEDIFYNSRLISILPMDFYYPGKAKTGDLPPRKEISKKYHPLIIKELKNLELIVLLGTYSTNYYLKDTKQKNLTETVKHYNNYLPEYFPLIHPSPLNARWMAKNRWFEQEVIPEFKKIINKILNNK